MTVDSLKFTDRGGVFPKLKAEVKATVYLVAQERGRDRRRHPAGPLGLARRPAGGSGRSRGRPLDPDRRGHAMKHFFLDLWHDLREKRLWPVAAVLLARAGGAAGGAVQAAPRTPATRPPSGRVPSVAGSARSRRRSARQRGC